MYRYDNYTDSFVRIDGEPNTGSTTVRVGVPLKEMVIIKKVELTDECIHKIADAVVRKFAGRKTEPQYSEDDMYWLSLAEDVANGKMSDAGANQAWLEYINHKDEPTISKMEQVEDEPQTERSE